MDAQKTSKLIISIVIAFAVVCIVIAAISIFKSCRHDPLPVFNPTALQDSATKIEKIINRKIDSALAIIKRQSGNIDSLKNANDFLVSQLDKRKAITEDLSDQYKAYRAAHDTINSFVKCDSLADENKELGRAINEYEASNAQLYDSLQSMIGNNSLVLAKKDYLYTTLRGSFDSLAQQYTIQTQSLQKAIKPKHWGIGLQSGVTYWSGVRIYAGLGIHYSFIKF